MNTPLSKPYSPRLPLKQDIIVSIFEQARAGGFEIPDEIRGMDIDLVWPAVIYRHDFAKAFWGEDRRVGMYTHYMQEGNGWEMIPAWRFNLQEMVLTNDPITYLQKFLKKIIQ